MEIATKCAETALQYRVRFGCSGVLLKTEYLIMSVVKDWTGNKKTTFVTLGASNHTDHDRAEHDYYATEPKAADILCDVETFEGST